MSSDTTENRVVTDKNFQTILAEMIEAGKCFAIKFSSPGCGPCKALAANLKEVSYVKSGEVVLFDADPADCPDLALEHMVMANPTLLLFDKTGQRKDNIKGSQTSAYLQNAMAKKLQLEN